MRASALTDIGKKRDMNQDRVYISMEKTGSFDNLFILADGMGGHRAGDQASKLFIETLTDYISKNTDAPAVTVFLSGISYANTCVYHRAQSDEGLYGMGTTCVCATISDQFLTVANIGDSRLYLIRDGKMRQVTRDHSLVEELVAAGEIKRDSKEYKKQKHIITKAVGIERDIRADIFDETLMPGDYVLMCSDGLTNMLSDRDILSIVKGKGTTGEKCAKLVKKANRKGGTDNISVILIENTEEGENDD